MTDPQIQLTLPLASVNYILQALARFPHGEVNDLIDTITEQTTSALKPKEAEA